MYRLTAVLEFESAAHADDAMAQLQARATNTRVAGGADAHTSYARLDNEDGSLRSMWHVDIFGIVRNGEWVAYDDAPDWIQPAGAHDSYPVTDALGSPTRVRHGGKVWENTAGAVNSWAPGVFGWTEVA